MSLGVLSFFFAFVSSQQEAKTLSEIQGQLEAKYQASELAKENYKASKEERREALRIFEISDPVAARAEYKAMMQKFPQSPEVWADFVLFLDRARKPDEAVTRAEQAVSLFPNQVRLKIIRDSMSSLSKTTNKSKRSEIRQEMDARLAAWNQLTLNHRNGKRLETKATTASSGLLDK